MPFHYESSRIYGELVLKIEKIDKQVQNQNLNDSIVSLIQGFHANIKVQKV